MAVLQKPHKQIANCIIPIEAVYPTDPMVIAVRQHNHDDLLMHIENKNNAYREAAMTACIYGESYCLKSILTYAPDTVEFDWNVLIRFAFVSKNKLSLIDTIMTFIPTDYRDECIGYALVWHAYDIIKHGRCARALIAQLNDPINTQPWYGALVLQSCTLNDVSMIRLIYHNMPRQLYNDCITYCSANNRAQILNIITGVEKMHLFKK